MRRIIGASVAASLFLSAVPAAAAAASPAQPAPSAQGQWTAFSQLNPAGAMALGGAGAVAQPASADTTYDNRSGFNFESAWPAIAVILAVIAFDIWTLVHHDHHGHFHISPS